MRLTLLLDGDIGSPLAEENLDDHPEAAKLKEALDAIAKQAQTTLIDEPAAVAKAAAAEAKAENEGTSKSTKSES